MLIFLLLIFSLLLIIKGADFFIEGSKSLAAYLNLPDIVTGVIIVAFGTSLPEWFVSTSAVLRNAGNISIGNVIGSNIANIGLCLGLTVILSPLLFKKEDFLKKNIALLSASILFTLFVVNDFLNRFAGIILLIFFIAFLKITLAGDQKESLSKYNLIQTFLYLFGGIGALIFGSNLLISNAVELATSIGVSERVIGLSLVALGTSLPELVTSVVAVYKKEFAISLGNIIGSNLFNILFIVGSVLLIKPISIDNHILVNDIPVMIFFIMLLFPFLFREKIGRLAGLLMLTVYAVYILSLFH